MENVYTVRLIKERHGPAMSRNGRSEPVRTSYGTSARVAGLIDDRSLISSLFYQ